VATNQISTSPYLLSDSNQASYRYNGELPPEESLEQQALNRRQHIANLLIQQGLAGAGGNRGQMVGRFYVPGSPLQGLGDMAKIGLGAYGTHMNDQSRQELAASNQQMLADAVANYKQGTSDVPAVAGSMPPPQSAVADSMAAPQATPPSMEAMPMGPPASPLSGGYQMGLDESGWAPKGPIQDLNAGAPPMPVPQQAVAQAMVPQMQGPVSPGTPGRARTPEERKIALIDLMASQHPQARQLGTILEKQEADAAERATNREFMGEQRQLDRDARLQGQEIQLNQAMMMGLITKEQKDQMLALQKQQIEQTGSIAKMHDQTQKSIAAMNKETGKTPPGYRATPEGNLQAIPGGPADLKQQGKREQASAALQSMSSDLDRLAVSANQILNHPGLAGITGLRGAVPDIPGTQAADARALLNKLKSQVGFTVLQNMRNNSKTGGALGQVSDNEGKRLENNLASVESAQSIDQMRRELQGIVDYVNGSKDRLSAAYESTYGEGTPAAAPQPEGMTPTVPAFHDPEKQKRYEEFRKNHTP
jgi:hypothetical protein